MNNRANILSILLPRQQITFLTSQMTLFQLSLIIPLYLPLKSFASSARTQNQSKNKIVVSIKHRKLQPHPFNLFY